MTHPIDRKIIWIASVPRTGSMWAFNITRELLRISGLQVFPERVPTDDMEMAELAKDAIVDTNPNHRWVLKVHAKLSSTTPRSYFISTNRDPRDALISRMRFLGDNFDSAMRIFQEMLELQSHYASFPKHSILHLDFTDISTVPEMVIAQIATALDLTVPQAVVRELAVRFSKANVQKRIDTLTKQSDDVQAHDFVDTVRNRDGSIRIFDKGTGFQSGHVSNYQDGDWRTLLTDEQQAQLDSQFGDWFRANNYQ